MSQSGTYASAVEIKVFSILYNVTVSIYEEDRLVETYNPGRIDHLHLLYDRRQQHYNCLEPACDTDPLRVNEDWHHEDICEMDSERSIHSDALSAVSIGMTFGCERSRPAPVDELSGNF